MAKKKSKLVIPATKQKRVISCVIGDIQKEIASSIKKCVKKELGTAKRRPSAQVKPKQASKALKARAKRYGIKLTIQRGGKRIPKSAAVLQAQVDRAAKRAKAKPKSRKKRGKKGRGRK